MRSRSVNRTRNCLYALRLILCLTLVVQLSLGLLGGLAANASEELRSGIVTEIATLYNDKALDRETRLERLREDPQAGRAMARLAEKVAYEREIMRDLGEIDREIAIDRFIHGIHQKRREEDGFYFELLAQLHARRAEPVLLKKLRSHVQQEERIGALLSAKALAYCGGAEAQREAAACVIQWHEEVLGFRNPAEGKNRHIGFAALWALSSQADVFELALEHAVGGGPQGRAAFITACIVKAIKEGRLKEGALKRVSERLIGLVEEEIEANGALAASVCAYEAAELFKAHPNLKPTKEAGRFTALLEQIAAAWRVQAMAFEGS